MSLQKPRTIDEQLQILKARGMNFANEERARVCLAHISYFRLKYYWKDMVDPNSEDEDFLESARFEDVVRRYDFDRRLRLILFDAIEVIEVALRTKIIQHMSLSAGNGQWYLERKWFEREEYFEDFVLDLKYEFNRSTEPFAKEFIGEHPDWDCDSIEGVSPDAWMIFESATFGTLSKMYKNLRNQSPEASRIANDFGLYSARELGGWLESVSVLRNIVAHHSRLWNRALAKKTLDLKGHRDKWLMTPLTESQKRKPYGVISAMVYLCDAVAPENGVKGKLLALLNEFQDVPYARLGFTGDWRKEPLWR